MKRLLVVLFSIAVFVTAPAFAHGVAKPLHGGVVAHANDLDFELVAQQDRLQVYVRDHGKPVDVSKAEGTISLLAGAQKQEAALKSIDGRLEASGSYNVAKGTKVVAVISLDGKTLIARFTLH